MELSEKLRNSYHKMYYKLGICRRNWSVIFYINEDGWKLHKKTLYNQARAMHMKETEFAQRFNYKKIYLPPLRKYIRIINN